MDLFNSLDKSLTNLDKAIHTKIEGSFIDNFLHELQDYFKSKEQIPIDNR